VKPKISVIIAARNEEQCIEECLRKIPKYKGDLEIIVVDDASEDNTYKLLMDYKRQVNSNIRVFRLNKPHGNTYAWDYGVRKSNGDLIFLLAADAQVNSFEEAIKHFRDEKVVQAIQKVEIECKVGLIPKLLAIYEKAANYIPGRKKGLRQDVEKETPTVCDSHALMRKKFYLEVNPPITKAAGEEYRFKELGNNIIKKKGYRLVYEPNFVESRGKANSLKRFIIQQRFYGRNSLANFDIKDIYSYLKIFRRLLFVLTVILAFISSIIVTPIFILLLFRLFMGLMGIDKRDLKYYPLVIPLMLLGDLIYDYGLIQSLVHRIITGKWLINK